MIRKLGFGSLLVTAALLVTSAVAGVADFKLTHAVPADAMITISSRDHDGREFINAQMERVWDAIERQHFENDLKRLIKRSMASPDDAAEFDTQWQQFRDLSATVEWRTLAQREFTYAMRMGMPMGSEWVLMFKPAEGRAAEDFEGLGAMAKHFAALIGDDVTLDTEETGDTIVHRLTLAEGPVPVMFTLARHKDAILFGFGTGMPEQSLALLRGEVDAKTGSIVAQPRFQEALKRLPTPKDMLMYMDIAAMMRETRNFAQMAAGASEQAAALPKLVDMINMWDYVATVAETDGMTTRNEAVARLQSNKGDAGLRKAFYGNKPLDDPLKFIPREAKSFSVGNGANWWALYQSILGFVTQNVPEGAGMVDMMKQQMATWPVDVEHMIRSLKGPYINFSAPGASSYATPHTVMMLQVSDPSGMQETLDKLQKLVAEMPELKEQNVALEDLNQAGTKGFKMLMLQPFLAMMVGQPCIGLHNDWLVITNGPQAVKLVVDLDSGQAESFARSDSFGSDGLPLEENVTSYGYTDLSNWHTETSAMMQMVPSMLQMASMFSGENIAKEPVVAAMLTTLGKAGGVVRECNFYKCSYAQTTFTDGLERTKTVVHYRKPPAAPGGASENMGN
jgi:hypothetical protein